MSIKDYSNNDYSRTDLDSILMLKRLSAMKAQVINRELKVNPPSCTVFRVAAAVRQFLPLHRS
jgi:hypothetical protein